MAANKLLSLSCLVLIGALLLAACLPIPTVPHGLGVVPDIEAFASLRTETATRADALLMLGEPNYRFDDDRFLMYEWAVAYGYVIVGGYTQAYPIPVTAPHYLCLEFERDSRLVRREKLTGSLYAKPKKAIRTCTKQPEEPDANTGDKAIVLLNIQCTVGNQPCQSFIKPKLTADPIFFLGLGSFETAGEPQYSSFIRNHFFFPDDSRRAGWTYFMLSPGVYYLAVSGPGISEAPSRTEPRWRIDVPENAKAVYVGTLQFAAKGEKHFFGGRSVIPAGTEPTIRDDSLLAQNLISKHFPDAGEPATILMQRWRPGYDPIPIRPQVQKNGANTIKAD